MLSPARATSARPVFLPRDRDNAFRDGSVAAASPCAHARPRASARRRDYPADVTSRGTPICEIGSFWKRLLMSCRRKRYRQKGKSKRSRYPVCAFLSLLPFPFSCPRVPFPCPLSLDRRARFRQPFFIELLNAPSICHRYRTIRTRAALTDAVACTLRPCRSAFADHIDTSYSPPPPPAAPDLGRRCTRPRSVPFAAARGCAVGQRGRGPDTLARRVRGCVSRRQSPCRPEHHLHSCRPSTGYTYSRTPPVASDSDRRRVCESESAGDEPAACNHR